jgi:hypothetical protein
MKSVTGKSRGFQKGDFVHTGAFPGIIISDVHTFAPCCEVWGFEHEGGSAYAKDLTKLTFEEFKLQIEAEGHKIETLNPFSDVSKKAIRKAQDESVGVAK